MRERILSRKPRNSKKKNIKRIREAPPERRTGASPHGRPVRRPALMPDRKKAKNKKRIWKRRANLLTAT